MPFCFSLLFFFSFKIIFSLNELQHWSILKIFQKFKQRIRLEKIKRIAIINFQVLFHVLSCLQIVTFNVNYKMENGNKK